MERTLTLSMTEGAGCGHSSLCIKSRALELLVNQSGGGNAEVCLLACHRIRSKDSLACCRPEENI